MMTSSRTELQETPERFGELRVRDMTAEEAAMFRKIAASYTSRNLPIPECIRTGG